MMVQDNFCCWDSINTAILQCERSNVVNLLEKFLQDHTDTNTISARYELQRVVWVLQQRMWWQLWSIIRLASYYSYICKLQKKILLLVHIILLDSTWTSSSSSAKIENRPFDLSIFRSSFQDRMKVRNSSWHPMEVTQFEQILMIAQ